MRGCRYGPCSAEQERNTVKRLEIETASRRPETNQKGHGQLSRRKMMEIMYREGQYYIFERDTLL